MHYIYKGYNASIYTNKTASLSYIDVYTTARLVIVSSSHLRLYIRSCGRLVIRRLARL